MSFTLSAVPHSPRIPQRPREGAAWVNCALQSDETINADPDKLNQVSFTAPGDESGICRDGDMFEVLSPRG